MVLESHKSHQEDTRPDRLPAESCQNILECCELGYIPEGNTDVTNRGSGEDHQHGLGLKADPLLDTGLLLQWMQEVGQRRSHQTSCIEI